MKNTDRIRYDVTVTNRDLPVTHRGYSGVMTISATTRAAAIKEARRIIWNAGHTSHDGRLAYSARIAADQSVEPGYAEDVS